MIRAVLCVVLELVLILVVLLVLAVPILLLFLRHCMSLPFVFTVSMCAQCRNYTRSLHAYFSIRFFAI